MHRTISHLPQAPAIGGMPAAPSPSHADLNSSAERPEELARPFLHQFLSAAWVDYDIVIWR